MRIGQVIRLWNDIKFSEMHCMLKNVENPMLYLEIMHFYLDFILSW